ncbi:MAG: hypothetical protein Q4C70_12810 [Planctomycetia bacterium]|nr:hypothetical protein [Planctomycetia bacterium]
MTKEGGEGNLLNPRFYDYGKCRPGEYIYCGVEFYENGHLYSYRTENITLKVGEWVEVPVGNDGTTSVAKIRKIGYYTAENAPYPVEKTKCILRLLPTGELPTEITDENESRNDSKNEDGNEHVSSFPIRCRPVILDFSPENRKIEKVQKDEPEHKTEYETEYEMEQEMEHKAENSENRENNTVRNPYSPDEIEEIVGVEWFRIHSENGIQPLLWLMNGFHDTCVKEIWYDSGAYVNQDLSMFPYNSRANLHLIIQGQWENPSTIELVFEEVSRFVLEPIPGDDEMCDIFDASMFLENGFFHWCDTDGYRDYAHLRDSIGVTWVRAPRVRWREVDRFLGQENVFVYRDEK